jgi:hypothetical protein
VGSAGQASSGAISFAYEERVELDSAATAELKRRAAKANNSLDLELRHFAA